MLTLTNALAPWGEEVSATLVAVASTDCDGDVRSDYTITVVYDSDLLGGAPTFNLVDEPSAYAFKLGQSWRQTLPRCAYGDDEGYVYEMDLRDADTFL